jgi:hypothetical protein
MTDPWMRRHRRHTSYDPSAGSHDPARRRTFISVGLATAIAAALLNFLLSQSKMPRAPEPVLVESTSEFTCP